MEEAMEEKKETAAEEVFGELVEKAREEGPGGLKSNIKAALTYVLGFISGIFFFVTEKEDKFIRFHALQSTIFTLGFAIVQIVIINPLFTFGLRALYNLFGFVVWLILIFKAYGGEKFKLPVIGEMAEKYV